MANRRARHWGLWILGGALVTIPLARRVEISNPRVHVRWQPGVGGDQRTLRERRYDLRDGSPIEAGSSTWQYRLGSSSRENIRALLNDPAVEDTAYIDQNTLTVDPREV